MRKFDELPDHEKELIMDSVDLKSLLHMLDTMFDKESEPESVIYELSKSAVKKFIGKIQARHQADTERIKKHCEGVHHETETVNHS